MANEKKCEKTVGRRRIRRVKKQRIDVKLRSNRFTYDPATLSEYTPVALQSRLFCGPGLGVVYMQLTPGALMSLYDFLDDVLFEMGLIDKCLGGGARGE